MEGARDAGVAAGGRICGIEERTAVVTHPVKNTVGAKSIGRPRAGIKVRREKGGLLVNAGEIGVLKSDALVVPLPSYLHVVDSDGEGSIKPSNGKSFFITTETFDPYHFIVELPNT